MKKPRFILLWVLMCCIQGGVLSVSGLAWYTWQYWVITLTTILAAIFFTEAFTE